ncbi:hypothetical protein HYZ41_02335 [archaeon]|nr:hypothetical protein [archaeon]
MDISDHLPSSIMENFHEFRESRYNFLYMCRSCSRSFDSRIALDNCKFCNGSIIELRSVKRGKRNVRSLVKKPIYRYYCPTCEKNFMTTESIPMCNVCRTDYLHVYTWDTLRRRDKIYIKLNKSLKNVFGREKEARMKPVVKIPSLSMIPSLNIRFSRNDEELPTN